jgi:hypothetical protein
LSSSLEYFPELYSSIRQLDANGRERILGQGRMRIRKYGSIAQYAGEPGVNGYIARLFVRLGRVSPGQIPKTGKTWPLFEGFLTISSFLSKQAGLDT